jgi:hypothetical protein
VESAAFEFGFERLNFGDGALCDGVGVAESVGEHFVGEIVETACGREFCSLGHWSPFGLD